jgi:hypothetical protein
MRTEALGMMQASPRTKLEAQLDGVAIKSIHDAVHIKSGGFILAQFSCPDNQNLPEIMGYAQILSIVD